MSVKKDPIKWLRGCASALCGTQNPHVLACTFRFLRSIRLVSQHAHSLTQAFLVNCRTNSFANKQRGVTLVELVVFIVIVGVALAGVLKVLEVANKGSADPLIRKQALAIAESLLLEIEQQPFTFCDPDDVNSATATTTAGCAVSQDKGGAALTSPTPATESRYSSADPFDNVADYGGFSMPGGGCAGICSPGDNTPLAGLSGYSANIGISRVGGVAPYAGFPADAVLQITVRVTGPANTEVALRGYRFRYAPNI